MEILRNLYQELKSSLAKEISGYVAAHERPMCNADPAREFEGMSKVFARFKAALVVPLLHDGDCLGTISLYNNNSDFYTPTHLSLLQWVAEQLAPLLREASGTDSSGSSNRDYRAYFLPLCGGTQALAHAEKSEAPLSLLYLKIKHFRQSTALYGSGSGDLILRKVADILRSELRQTDILIRYGEDGFIALLPGVSGPQAIRYLNRLLQLIKSSPVSLAPEIPPISIATRRLPPTRMKDRTHSHCFKLHKESSSIRRSLIIPRSRRPTAMFLNSLRESELQRSVFAQVKRFRSQCLI